MVSIEALEDVPLREIWRDEARDFTPWLAANPEHLAKALGMDLELEGSEVSVGPFSADVVLRDANTGQLVVVENLLEQTDHDHMGKLITYAAGLKADWAILVAKVFRPEHRSALNWLNTISTDDKGFFGVEVQAVRIGDSQPAVRLDVVVEPDDFSRQARQSTTATSESRSRYIEWWAEFLPAFHEAHPGWSNAKSAPASNWMNFPTGRSDIKYDLSFAYPTGASNYSLRAGIYVSDGETDFRLLEEQRSAIEANCSLELQWEHLPHARASRVTVYLDPADPAERENWPRYREWAVHALGEFRRVFAGPINSLP